MVSLFPFDAGNLLTFLVAISATSLTLLVINREFLNQRFNLKKTLDSEGKKRALTYVGWNLRLFAGMIMSQLVLGLVLMIRILLEEKAEWFDYYLILWQAINIAIWVMVFGYYIVYNFFFRLPLRH
ncbi:MAG: hypothetical protein OEQ15_04250 [Nitrosopumilus sp.]|nr:hypothetical protein [Nitrosopumilus sp.]MDH3794383.1 hypothetical protein [Nitrosopumilus sp.]